MCDLKDDILVELSNEEIEAYRVFYKNLNNIEYVYVHLYLKNQLRWNILMSQYTEQEKNEISDRCTFYLANFFRSTTPIHFQMQDEILSPSEWQH